jgi:hypothetical protein
MPKDKKPTPAEKLRKTIESQWEKGRKKAKSQEMRDFDKEKKRKVSKGGYK